MIFKFQQGGNALPPLVSYLPVMVTDETADTVPEATKPAASKGGGLIDENIEDLIKNLLILPSDMGLITGKLRNLMLILLYSPVANTSSIASAYLQILNDINNARFNISYYNKAYERANITGGINEIAISDRGEVFTMNNQGDFKLMTPEALRSQSEYQPLTNSDLLLLRAKSPKLAMDSQLTKIVQNGIGVPAVQGMINSIITGLGSTTSSLEGYSARVNGQIITGIELLQLAVMKGAVTKNLTNLSVDGLYKNKLLTKDLAVLVANALNYVYTMLPANAKTLLKLKTNGSEKEVLALLQSLIVSKYTNDVQFGTDLLKDLHIDGTKISEKELEDKNKINPAVAFQLDMGTETLLPINAGGTDSLNILAYRMPVLNKEGKNLGITTLDKVASDSVYGGIFNFSQVTMGDLTLDMSSAKNIAVDSSSIYKVYLPVDQLKLSMGITAPNLDYLNTLQKVREHIKESGAKTPEEINLAYEDFGLPPFVTLDGKVNQDFYKPFGVMNGTALSDAFNDDISLIEENRNFEVIDDENIINNNWAAIKGADSKETFDDKGFFNDLGIGSYLLMVKGLVYLPLNSLDPTLGMYSGGDSPTITLLQETREAYLLDLRARNFKPQGQLKL